jgi:hypothetical protein
MKKLALAIAFAAPVTSLPVHAAPALVQIGVGGCSMVDGDGNPFFAVSPNVKVKVATESTGSTLILTCHVDDVPNHTGKAVIYNLANTGSQCMINDPLLGGSPIPTNRWQSVVSAGGSTFTGSADLSCSFNAPSGQ